jgi:hypothetical protein
MRSHRYACPGSPRRSAFAGYRFPPEVITLAVRWYLRFVKGAFIEIPPLTWVSSRLGRLTGSRRCELRRLLIRLGRGECAEGGRQPPFSGVVRSPGSGEGSGRPDEGAGGSRLRDPSSWRTPSAA